MAGTLIKTGLTAAGGAVGGPVGAGVGAAVGGAVTGDNAYEAIGSGIKTGASAGVGDAAGMGPTAPGSKTGLGSIGPWQSKMKTLATALGVDNLKAIANTTSGALKEMGQGAGDQSQQEQQVASMFANNPSLLNKLMGN